MFRSCLKCFWYSRQSCFKAYFYYYFYYYYYYYYYSTAAINASIRSNNSNWKVADYMYIYVYTHTFQIL
jgi:hypothetical protein